MKNIENRLFMPKAKSTPSASERHSCPRTICIQTVYFINLTHKHNFIGNNTFFNTSFSRTINKDIAVQNFNCLGDGLWTMQTLP